ncbi:hypothetical protein R3P38DRAFT_2778704 [Favolaschia claudopus]|uniref:F-box domain-containing protein n=1 Tax=Favolaschia claudopus TaxID=2862362 RepID=A0AAW0BFK2_9AGAR
MPPSPRITRTKLRIKKTRTYTKHSLLLLRDCSDKAALLRVQHQMAQLNVQCNAWTEGEQGTWGPSEWLLSAEERQTNWDLVLSDMQSPRFEHPMKAPAVQVSSIPQDLDSDRSGLLRRLRLSGSLTSNLSADELGISDWIPTGAALLSGYDQLVHELRKKLELAKFRQACAKHILLGSSYGLSSIGRVPNELWNEIFGLACDRRTGWPEVTLRTLTQVCKQWRTLLTASPAAALWNPVDLRDSGGPIAARKAQLSYVTSSNILELVMSADDTRTDHDLLQSVFRQPIRNPPIKRIRRLTIHDVYSSTGIANRSLFSQSAAIPDIDELYIVGAHWFVGEYPSVNGLPAWFASLDQNQLQPELHIERGITTLTLIQTLEPEHTLHVPWSSLTVYSELNTARANGIIPSSHLRRLSSLTSLSLGGVFLPHISDTGRVELHELTYFHYIVPWSWVPGIEAFEGVNCPNLTRLHLYGSSWNTPCLSEASERFHADLARFLPRCPFLDTLELALPVPYSSAVLINHLRACPSLLHLELDFCHPELVNDSLFQELSDTTLVPHLRFLRLVDGGHSRTHPSALDEIDAVPTLIRMIRIRFRNNLRRLSFRPKHREMHSYYSERTILEWESKLPSKWDRLPVYGFEWNLPHAARLAIEELVLTDGLSGIELLPQ